LSGAYSPLEIEFAWDWQAFWPELAAGLVTFLLGVLVTLGALRFETWLRGREAFKRFQGLAREVLKDLREIDRVIEVWAQQTERDQRLVRDGIMLLTWEVPAVQTRFAEEGLHVTTEIAHRYFAEARKLAETWNAQLGTAGGLTDETQSRIQLAIVGTRENVKAAIQEIRNAAKLSESS
jgi:hypothetical protein